jgi:hypothetical protein
MQPSNPLSETRVWTCILTNLCATPGLGSIMARRVIAGCGQLVLAVAGFLLITGWMCILFYRQFNEAMEKPVTVNPRDWMWQIGVILFGAAWLWSLVTSISLLLEVKRQRAKGVENVPPRINDVSGGTSQK